MVELGEGWTIADLARELSAPLVVTTTTGLGSLNHALLTLEAIERRGVGCAGLIGGSVPADPDLATGADAGGIFRIRWFRPHSRAVARRDPARRGSAHSGRVRPRGAPVDIAAPGA